MNGAAIPLVMVAVAMLFGGKKKKKTTKSKTDTDDDRDRPEYDDDDRRKRPPNRKKKEPNTDFDDDLDDDDYDPEFSDEECGPGWVLVDDECLWRSEYEAPNVPYIEDAVAAGEGYIDRWPDQIETGSIVLDYEYDWWQSAAGLAYQIIWTYDLGPVNEETGNRDTGEACIDVFPFVTHDFEWYEQRPLPDDYIGETNTDTDSPEWQAFYQAQEQWEEEYLAYRAEIQSLMPGLDLLYWTLVATIKAHYLDVYGDDG